MRAVSQCLILAAGNGSRIGVAVTVTEKWTNHSSSAKRKTLHHFSRDEEAITMPPGMDHGKLEISYR